MQTQPTHSDAAGAAPGAPLRLRLRHIAGSRAGTASEVTETVMMGRRPDCGVSFDANRDLLVSGSHARLIADSGRWWLEDLGSTNGTFLNGRKLEAREAVCHGDTASLGDPGHAGSVSFELDWPGGPTRPAAGGHSAGPEATTRGGESVVCRCSFCRARYAVAADMVGRTAPCPSCGRTEVVRPSVQLSFGGSTEPVAPPPGPDAAASAVAPGTEAPSGLRRFFGGISNFYNKLRERPRLRKAIAELEERRTRNEAALRSACAELGRALWDGGRPEMRSAPEAGDLQRAGDQRAAAAGRAAALEAEAAKVRAERDARLRECSDAQAAAAAAQSRAEVGAAEAAARAAAIENEARIAAAPLLEAVRRAAEALTRFSADHGAGRPVAEDLIARGAAVTGSVIELLEPHRAGAQSPPAGVFVRLSEARARAVTAASEVEDARRAAAAAEARRSQTAADFERRLAESAQAAAAARAEEAKILGDMRERLASAGTWALGQGWASLLTQPEAGAAREARRVLDEANAELTAARNALRELGGDTAVEEGPRP